MRLGDSSFVVAGGMESMSNAPHVVRELRWGARIGDAALIDVMQHDGLFCAFDHCTMGESSDHKNERLRHRQERTRRVGGTKPPAAAEAAAKRPTRTEIVPVEVPRRKGTRQVVAADEGIRADASFESLSALSPPSAPGGPSPRATHRRSPTVRPLWSWPIASAAGAAEPRSSPRYWLTARSVGVMPPSTSDRPRPSSWP